MQGQALSAERARQMKLQVSAFKSKLEQFAVKHKKEIQSDPAFRAKFHAMCATIGVDPLTSKKGVWSDLLGVGDFYYELAVRIIEICVATRPINGGIMSLRELLPVLQTKRITYTEKISRCAVSCPNRWLAHSLKTHSLTQLNLDYDVRFYMQ